MLAMGPGRLGRIYENKNIQRHGFSFDAFAHGGAAGAGQAAGRGGTEGSARRNNA